MCLFSWSIPFSVKIMSVTVILIICHNAKNVGLEKADAVAVVSNSKFISDW